MIKEEVKQEVAEVQPIAEEEQKEDPTFEEENKFVINDKEIYRRYYIPAWYSHLPNEYGVQ